MGYSGFSSSGNCRKAHPLRRKADIEAIAEETMALDTLAMALCPDDMLTNYRQRSFTQQRHGKKISVLPIWRQYRKDAQQLMAAYRIAPWLKRFPLKFARLAAEVLLNSPTD